MLTRYDRRDGQEKDIQPYPFFFSGQPASSMSERWQWTFPIVFDPLDPSTMYCSSQHVFKTTNGGQELDHHQPRPDARRPQDAGRFRRPHHQGSERPRDLRHDLHHRAVASAKKEPSGPAPTTASPTSPATAGKDWDEDHPRRAPALQPHRHDRRVVAQARHRVSRGQPLPDGRPRALHLQDGRLRQALDQNRHRHPAGGLRARHPRGSRAARPALRGHRAQHLHVDRRRRALEVARLQPARHAGSRHRGREERPRHRDAWPLLLHPRRHQLDSPGHARDRQGLGASVQARGRRA